MRFWKSTSLKRFLKRYEIGFYSRGTIRMKLKYFIQSNALFIVGDELQDGQQERGIDLSIKVKWRLSLNEFGDRILTVRLMKSGSLLDGKLVDKIGELQALFGGAVLEKSNELEFVEYRLIYKQGEQEEIFVEEENDADPSGFIKLNRYYRWDYQRHPHALFAGNSGSGKSYLLYSVIYKMLAETSKKNIFICDGKFDELEELAKVQFGLSRVARTAEEIADFVELVGFKMEDRYKQKQRNLEPIFLVIDEYAALQLALDKKKMVEVNQNLKNIVLKGRASNVHCLIAMQRVEGSSIDLAIRDNMAVRVMLGNVSKENFSMMFGESRNDKDIIKRDRGQGYIKIDGTDLKLFESPRIRLFE